MTALALAAGALLAAQAIEQIAPPPAPAAALRTEQAAPPDADAAAIAQLPPVARRVAQPAPRVPPPAVPSAVDVARTYVSVLSPTTAPRPEATARELGVDTIVGLAAQARPAAVPATPGAGAGTPGGATVVLTPPR